jgi:hypothetical protein
MPRKTFKLNGTDIGLDARPDRLDLRDLPYRPPVVNLPAMFPDNLQEQLPAFVQTGLILQQGAEGACTGFGLAAVINYLRWTDACRRSETFTEKERVSQRMLYQLARFYDEWQGEDYEGSSCRGALKGWQRHGVCLELKWQYIPGSYVAPDQDWSTDAIKRPLGIYYRIQRDAVVDMQAAIYQTGAIYVSANVHDGWMLSSNGNKKRSPNRMELPIIKQKRSSGSAGGNAFAIVGYNQEGFIVQNSWGTEWGWNGFAILPYDDWVEHGSDAWVVSLGVPVNRNAGPAMDGIPQAAPEYYVSGSTRWRVEGAGIDWFGRLADPLATRSDVWDKKNAYWHALVTGNDGTLINRIPEAENAPECVKLVSYQQPKDWFDKNIGDKTWNLAIYAHGGLVEEETSVRGIRVLGPKFEENQIYPVFVTWRSGLSEVLGQIILDDVKKIFWPDTSSASWPAGSRH